VPVIVEMDFYKALTVNGVMTEGLMEIMEKFVLMTERGRVRLMEIVRAALAGRFALRVVLARRRIVEILQ